MQSWVSRFSLGSLPNSVSWVKTFHPSLDSPAHLIKSEEAVFLCVVQKKTPGSKDSSTSGLSPRGHLERQAEFHASTQDEA